MSVPFYFRAIAMSIRARCGIVLCRLFGHAWGEFEGHGDRTQGSVGNMEVTLCRRCYAVKDWIKDA